jgi:hypothetical protein
VGGLSIINRRTGEQIVVPRFVGIEKGEALTAAALDCHLAGRFDSLSPIWRLAKMGSQRSVLAYLPL